MYPVQNLSLIDDKNMTYKKSWKDLIELLTNNKIIFEHLLKEDDCIMMNNSFIYILNDNWQRSPWNCCQNYGYERKYDIKNVKYSDEIIYYKLRNFIQYVKIKYNIKDEYSDIPRLIIIDRKNNRFFDKHKLNELTIYYKNKSNILFNGIKILEDMNFLEQINLFHNNEIIIFRHGTCLTNVLWTKSNTLVFDLDIRTNREYVTKRICKSTLAKHIYLNYNKYTIEDINNIINNEFKI